MTTIQVKASISDAVAQANPGDVIEVPQGDWQEDRIVINVPGVTLRPAPEATPTIRVPRIIIAAADVTVKGMIFIS